MADLYPSEVDAIDTESARIEQHARELVAQAEREASLYSETPTPVTQEPDVSFIRLLPVGNTSREVFDAAESIALTEGYDITSFRCDRINGEWRGSFAARRKP